MLKHYNIVSGCFHTQSNSPGRMQMSMRKIFNADKYFNPAIMTDFIGTLCTMTPEALKTGICIQSRHLSCRHHNLYYVKWS